MKKRTKNKIKKLLPKIGKWSLVIGLALLSIYLSVHSFLSLHNGASIQDVDGHKYVPVLSELLLIIVVVLFMLFILKITTELKTIYIVLLGMILLGVIGWFGYWAFDFTRQDPVEGLLKVLIIAGSIALITTIGLWYESYSRRKHKKNSKRKPAAPKD